MKIEWNNKYTTIAIYAFLVLVAVISFASVLNNLAIFKGMLVTLWAPFRSIVIGIAIAFVLNPVVKFCENKAFPLIDKKGRVKRGGRRAISLIVTYIVAFVCLIAFFMGIIPGMVDNIQRLLTKSADYIVLAELLITRLTEEMPDQLATEITEFVMGYTTDIVAQVYKILSSSVPAILGYTMQFTGMLLRFLIGIIVSVYLLADKERFLTQLRKLTYAVFPKEGADWLISVGGYTNKMFNGFIIGKLFDSIIIGLLCFIGVTLLGIQNAMLVALLTGLFNMIPYVGPFIGAVPCFFIIVVDSPTDALVFLVFLIALQQLDGNIIGPMILGESIGISSFWVFLAITIFGGYFGLIGMFVGVPIFAVIYWIVSQFVYSRLSKKGLLDMEATGDTTPENPPESEVT